jgi:hypothetical protein
LIYHPGDIVKSQGILGKVVNGWGMSAIQTLQSGYPLTPSITNDRTLYNAVFVSERPDLCSSYNPSTFKNGINTGNRSSSTFFDTSMLCLPASGTLGNAPIGLFTGPGIDTTNFSFTKDTKARFLGEAGNVEFRFEMFNAFNHPSFNNPTLAVFSASSSQCPAGGSPAALTTAGCSGEVPATAGRDSLSTLTQMRQLQVSLKIEF